MKAFFHQLFDYNFYCNKKLIKTCIRLESIPENSVRLFSHVLNAHHIWNARILDQAPALGVWDVHEASSWGDVHYQNQRDSFEIITNAGPFDKRITYETSEGRTFANSLQDILFHIINHSTHHRAQVATDFRASGLEPLALDYIVYKR
jgi:uncharacterized damage-inducible protein DinB